MGTVIGTLTVNLEANTASFTADLGKAGNSLENLSDKAGKAGESMDFSMTKARGGLMMVEESVGVHLPRHLNMLIAEIPGVGAAFETMLPIIGVVAAIAIVAKLIEKHEELVAKTREAAVAIEDMTIKVDDQSNSMELANLKLDDQLRKIDGYGSHFHGFQEALIQSKVEVDKLASSFAVDFAKIDKVIIDSTSLSGRFWEGLKGGQNIGDLFSGIEPVQNQLHTFNDALEKVNETRMKLAEAPPGSDEEKKLTADLKAGYQSVGNAAEQAYKIVKEYTPDNVELLGNLRQAVITAGHAFKDLGLEATHIKLDDHLLKAEQVKEGQEALQKADAAAQELAHTLERFKELTSPFKSVAAANKDLEKELDITNVRAIERFKALADTAKQMRAVEEEAAKGEIALAAEKEKGGEEADRHRLAMHHATIQATVKAELEGAQKSYQVELAGYNQEQALLDPTKDAVKIQALNDKKLQLEQKYWNDRQKIVNKGEEQLGAIVRHGEEAIAGAISKNIAKSIVEGKNLADSMSQMGKQLLEDALANALKMILIGDMKQAKDAGHAAASAFTWVMQDMPFPANAILAPIAAAAAFAGVMAFEEGGQIPGSGAVPIIGHGGETVVSKALTDKVEAADGKNVSQVTHNTTHIDARGADAGVEQRVHRAIREAEQRSVARSVAISSDRAARRS